MQKNNDFVLVPVKAFEAMESVLFAALIEPKSTQGHVHRYVKVRDRFGLKVNTSTWKCSCGDKVQSS